MSRKKKILIVDDERDLVELISMNLVRHGYDVVNWAWKWPASIFPT
jgi:DNA-binding response OmpR family regulator